MYNTYPWLSRQFYGKKSAHYIQSFTVFLADIQISRIYADNGKFGWNMAEEPR